MNQKELIALVAKEVGSNENFVGAVLGYVFYHIAKTVTQGEWVEFRGFGRFMSRKRAARTGRNPKTGAKLTIPATTVPVFWPGAAFKESVAAKKSGDKGIQRPWMLSSIEK